MELFISIAGSCLMFYGAGKAVSCIEPLSYPFGDTYLTDKGRTWMTQSKRIEYIAKICFWVSIAAIGFSMIGVGIPFAVVVGVKTAIPCLIGSALVLFLCSKGIRSIANGFRETTQASDSSSDL